MKCPCCKGKLNQIDEEIICEDCGCTYELEYLGYYPEGSNSIVDRIDLPNPECKEAGE